MILNRLTLVNFGVYRGQHEFDLRPRGAGPIVIFGGKNGAGKTTLLEATRLCLHGRLAVDIHATRAGRRVSTRVPKQADYERHLLDRIHRNGTFRIGDQISGTNDRNGLTSLDWASVALEFEYAIAGERQTYNVERGWQRKGKGVEETLRVFQDGQRLDGMDGEQWEHFIRELIPLGLAQLFFLDSEKIQSLTSGSRELYRATLSQTIKSLLGLNAVDQLRADLTVYRRRQQKGNRVDVIARRIKSLEDELAGTQTKKGGLQAQLVALDDQIGVVEAKITQQEHEIARIGGGFAEKRQDYKAAQVRLQTEIESLEQAIRELCAGLLPFALTPVYTAAVRSQLLREAEYQNWLASKTFFEQKLDDLRAQIASPEFWRGTGAEALTPLQETIGERVIRALQSMIESPVTGIKSPEAMRDVTLRHHASEPEQMRLLQWIDESQRRLPGQLEQLTTQLTRSRDELDEIEDALQRVPPDEVLGPLMETLNAYHQELGGLAQQRLQIEEALRRLELQGEDLERQLSSAYEVKAAREKLAEKIRRAVDVQLVLDDFQDKLLQLRVSQLEAAFGQRFNQLCRKERLVERVAIDPHDFSVTLIGAGGDVVSQNELSAGEKQIYAIALLWALRQVSGRPLPVLIDAPLGRLDSDHRQNLVQQFFPRASHQVILFSTDTEVDAEFYAALQDSVSHAYHLDFDQAQRTTQVSQGYFWGTDPQERESNPQERGSNGREAG